MALNPSAPDFVPAARHAAARFGQGRPVSGPVFEVREVEGRGRGLVATRYIPRESLVLCETPLMTTGKFRDEIWPAYLCLKEKDKAIYDSLHSWIPEHVRQELEHFCRTEIFANSEHDLDGEQGDQLLARAVRVMSIFATNRTETIPEGVAVYAHGSRLNHSCRPNVTHTYNPTRNALTVYAIRDIDADEELCTSYLGPWSNYEPAHERAPLLLANWGFTCTCKACADPSGISDQRRQLMNTLEWGLHVFEKGPPITHPAVPLTLQAALAQATHVVSVILEEGIYTLDLADALRRVGVGALNLGYYERALKAAYTEQAVERSNLGVDHPSLPRRQYITTSQFIADIYNFIRATGGDRAVHMYRGIIFPGMSRRQRKRARKNAERFRNAEVRAGYAVANYNS